jgi:glycosyltransferase involved in cell wall biosynthesis
MKLEKRLKIALLGTVGVPGRYGGFETLAENLVRYHNRTEQVSEITVWCSSKDNAEKFDHFMGARLKYIALRANGLSSVLYDAMSLWQATREGCDRIVLLGVSGALFLPFIRLISNVQVVTNIDGIEWKRAKWSALARAFLRASERAAVKFSHSVVADNQAIADHVWDQYGQKCTVIAYGGDHALNSSNDRVAPGVPSSYALALCRIEPENNVHMILEGWKKIEMPLVFVGNWSYSRYGRELKEHYSSVSNIFLLEPVYDANTLYSLRSKASLYVHGHSAGGTNPSLVEMMHFAVPILAYGCSFNRHSTEDRAWYFDTSIELANLVERLQSEGAPAMGEAMREIACRRYTWELIGKAYFDLLEGSTEKNS